MFLFLNPLSSVVVFCLVRWTVLVLWPARSSRSHTASCTTTRQDCQLPLDASIEDSYHHHIIYLESYFITIYFFFQKQTINPFDFEIFREWAIRQALVKLVAWKFKIVQDIGVTLDSNSLASMSDFFVTLYKLFKSSVRYAFYPFILNITRSLALGFF